MVPFWCGLAALPEKRRDGLVALLRRRRVRGNFAEAAGSRVVAGRGRAHWNASGSRAGGGRGHGDRGTGRSAISPDWPRDGSAGRCRAGVSATTAHAQATRREYDRDRDGEKRRERSLTDNFFNYATAGTVYTGFIARPVRPVALIFIPGPVAGSGQFVREGAA